jgi:ABC-type Fe3+-hydroxamate transport system substrate-binding protein
MTSENTFTDQLNREVRLTRFPPRRIVSLVPSQTELLADLGLEEAVVGITKFCIHPTAWFQEKQRVGGTKTVNLAKVAALQPDLVIGNREENDRGQIEALSAQYPVWMSDIATLEDALDMIRRIGALTGRLQQAEMIAADIQAAFSEHPIPKEQPPRRAAYFIWQKPWMVAASGTFIDDMLRRAGFVNAFGALGRYPEINAEQLAAASPEYILLSSEPFPFSEKHFAPLREICPLSEIRIVDGALFSWYGSRLLKAPAYFRNLRNSLNFAAD